MSNNLIYAMGVVPEEIAGDATIVTIIGVRERTIYANYPGKISYFESFETTGSHTLQTLEVCDAAREFFPLALIVASNGRDGPVAERITFCSETHYILCPLFRQAQAEAAQYKPDQDQVNDATRHAMTFIRRANDGTSDGDKLRNSAWGPPERPTKSGSRRSRA